MDGVVFAVSALVLIRTLRRIASVPLRSLLTLGLVLLIAYGIAVAANDFWHGQVIKRGWSTTEVFPSVLWPAATLDWGVVLAFTVLLWLVMMRSVRPPSSD